jgi:uncharacterized protein YkwD
MRRAALLILSLTIACDPAERDRDPPRTNNRDASVGDGSTDAGTDGSLGLDGGTDLDAAGRDATIPDSGDPDDWPPNLAVTEDQMLVLVNQQRAQGANCGGANYGPTSALTMNARLRTAARLHSKDMADQDYFEHTSLDGRTFARRISDQGYSGFTVGENIAAGNATAMDTFLQWLHSPGHCRNMMEPSFREIGIGHAVNRSSQYNDYWTQDFGG